ncbi:hypothetical protein [Membranihabitans maritimus]|uniref:hypothetical protein n=1 Tax=Membranihabitans maritimus TaxID=2904244 RepID=UPI001F34FF81|nr:hypothetical protein [Membranihabitans maritimus]
MENTKIYKLLRETPAQDLEKIESFLNSGFSTQSITIRKFFRLIKKSITKGKNAPDRHVIWKSLYNSRPFKDGTFRKLCTDLLTEIESALAHLYFEENDKAQAVHYLHYLKSNELGDTFFFKEITKIKNQFKKRRKSSGSFYYYQYRLEELEYNSKNLSGSAWNIANIENIDQNLNNFFIIEKLRVALSYFSRQKYIQIEKELPFLHTIFDLVEENKFFNNFLIELYYYAVKTYEPNDGDSHYYNLKQALLQNFASIDIQNSRELFTIALSYCIGKINQNIQEFYRETFEWYQTMLREKVLFQKGQLPSTTFRNIVLISIRLKEYEWANQFIDENSNYLEKDKRESTKMLSLGQLYFNTRDYSKVIESLMNVDYLDVSYNLQSKLILAATYYEIGELDLLSNFLATFNTYIRRKKPSMSSDKYHRHQRFISILNQMIKTRETDREKWSEIHKKMKENNRIVSYSWLLEKVTEKIKN